MIYALIAGGVLGLVVCAATYVIELQEKQSELAGRMADLEYRLSSLEAEAEKDPYDWMDDETYGRWMAYRDEP